MLRLLQNAKILHADFQRLLDIQGEGEVLPPLIFEIPNDDETPNSITRSEIIPTHAIHITPPARILPGPSAPQKIPKNHGRSKPKTTPTATRVVEDVPAYVQLDIGEVVVEVAEEEVEEEGEGEQNKENEEVVMIE